MKKKKKKGNFKMEAEEDMQSLNRLVEIKRDVK